MQPDAIEHIEHCWIPLADGIRLSARIWLPAGARARPVPAIFELIPYRKRDSYRAIDEAIHPHFAAQGYACVRVDIRGSGESEGILEDEYLPSEQQDALQVLEWIAAQPWCDGNTGMMGISWGGFNALQVAAHRPPSLKAIVTVASTDDRYADDVHYMGGCLLNDNFSWAAQMLLRSSRPPDPAIVGEVWREAWLRRLELTPPLIETWLSHPWRDAYWRQGSVGEDYAAITCPVLAIAGWADGYSNTVGRLVENLSVPRQGLVGPWAHDYPHEATPGPRIGFLQQATLWWDRWLKGRDNGIDREAAYRVWMQDSAAPANYQAERPGRWIAETAVPPPSVRPTAFGLVPGQLRRAEGWGHLELASPTATGLGFGNWCPYGIGPELPSDQRDDDARSLVFDGEVLTEALEILGAPSVELTVASDQPDALLCARLCDVAADGSSTLVSYGLLNLTHRDGHAAPAALVPGQPYRVRLRLNDCAHRFLPGRRFRLALSNGYWPLAWPSPRRTRLGIDLAGARLELPLRLPQPEDEDPSPLPPPERLPGLATEVLRAGGQARRVLREQGGELTVVEIDRDGGRLRIPAIDMTLETLTHERYEIGDADPLSARIEIRASQSMSRDGWQVETRTKSSLSATPEEFLVDLELDAWDGGRRVFSRNWHFAVPRRLV